MFASNGSANRAGAAVRPVVEIASKYTLKLVPGTNEWEIVKK